MNDNVLASMLDERPTEVVASKDAKPTKHAVLVDRWGIRTGERLATEWHKDADLVTDAHTVCFEPGPQINTTCADLVKQKWFSELLSNPEFRAIHTSTHLHGYLSEIGAKQISDRYEKYLSNLSDEDRSEIERGAEEIATEMKRSLTVSEAAHCMATEVKDANTAAKVFGLGDGKNSSLSSDSTADSFRRVRDNRRLREIARQAGRFIQLAQSLQRTKVVHGMDDIVGVELGDNIGRLVPSELAQMTDVDLELDLLRRLVEKQAICHDYRSVQRLGQGPIMIMVDESASMSDDNRIVIAKGFALALAWLAKHQKRWCALVGWSSGAYLNELLVEPGTSTPELMNWALKFWEGSTNPPVNKIPELFASMGAPEGKTDIIWITDGECSPKYDEFTLWRESHECRVWTIGMDCDAESFQPFSDHVVSVTNLNCEHPVVSEILSL